MTGMKVNKKIKDKAPCLHCPDRFPGCHGKCERYIKWREPYLAIREARLKNIEADSVAVNRIRKAIKERRHKNG